MIGALGPSIQLGLRVADATREARLETIRSSAEHSRAIAGFRDRIAAVRSVEDLMADRELYVFVMKAFDLEDQIFGKAMIRKVLESDRADPTSLVRRLTDPRFMELHKGLGFGPGGGGTTLTQSGAWQDLIVARYVERQFIDAETDRSAGVGAVLEFRQKAPAVRTWFDVLKDPAMGRFMRTALGIPDEAVRLDVDRQAALFADKFDITKLRDPAERARLERHYAIVTDARDPGRLMQNAAVKLMNAAVSAGAGGGRFVPITLDITAVAGLPRQPYS